MILKERRMYKNNYGIRQTKWAQQNHLIKYSSGK